jgi:hypothetical protein
MSTQTMKKRTNKKIQRIKQLSAYEIFRVKSFKAVGRSFPLMLFPGRRDEISRVVVNRWPWSTGVYTDRKDFATSLTLDIKYIFPKSTGRLAHLKNRKDAWIAKKVIGIILNMWWPKGGELVTLSELGKS